MTGIKWKAHIPDWKRILTYGLFLLGFYMLAMLLGVQAWAADKGGPRGKVATTEVVENPAARWDGCFASIIGSYAKEEAFIFDSSNAGAGVGAGCRTRLSGTSLVAGVKADYLFHGLQEGIQQADRSWSLVATMGILISPVSQLYGLIGYTQLDGTFAIPDVDKGLTLGVGFEHFITKNLTLGAKYRHIDLGDAGGGVFTSSRDEVRGFLSWAF